MSYEPRPEVSAVNTFLFVDGDGKVFVNYLAVLTEDAGRESIPSGLRRQTVRSPTSAPRSRSSWCGRRVLVQHSANRAAR
jgi:hypothetical protein